MTAIDNTPSNKNFLSPLNFQFQLKRAPHLNFFIQKLNIPAIKLPVAEIPTMFNYIPDPGNKVEYSDLQVTFKVDEDFANYLEVHNWIRSLGFPERFEERQTVSREPEYTGNGIHSDIVVLALNASKRPNFEITFRNAFPTDLSEINFDATLEDVQYVTATANFRYMLFDIRKIT
jgi:hypothetical protein